MKKTLLLLLITTASYSQTLLKLKAIEYAPGAGYCVITNSLGVQTYTPCSSLSSTVVPTLQQVTNAGANTTNDITANSFGTTNGFAAVTETQITLIKGDGTTPLFEADNTIDKVKYLGNEVATINQLPTITASTNITVSGTSPNYTISAASGGGTPSLTASYIGYGDGSNNLTGSSSLTYSNSILKLNPSVVSTETRSAMPLQIGGDFITLGSSSSASLTPTFIEFLKSNGSGGFHTPRGTVGFLGAYEMNLSVNMNYTGAIHKYYDATIPAIWSFMGSTGTYGYQYVPANNPNTGDIYTTYGCIPFRADAYNQPATGRGIDGFSKVQTAVISLADLNNTATVTATPAEIKLTGGFLQFTGATGYDFRMTQQLGLVSYNTNTGTATDLNLMTPFSTNQGGNGINAFSYSTTTGYKEGMRGTAEDGLVNIGVTGKAVKTKANGTNIGLMGVASNTNATTPKQIGGFFGLTGIADALPASLTSAALMADNGTSTSNILTLRDNATIVFEVIDGGKVVLGNTIRLKGYTVATLPAGTQGDKAFVTDALAPTYNAIVAGGGAVVCEVFYNGTNWITN